MGLNNMLACLTGGGRLSDTLNPEQKCLEVPNMQSGDPPTCLPHIAHRPGEDKGVKKVAKTSALEQRHKRTGEKQSLRAGGPRAINMRGGRPGPQTPPLSGSKDGLVLGSPHPWSKRMHGSTFRHLGEPVCVRAKRRAEQCGAEVVLQAHSGVRNSVVQKWFCRHIAARAKLFHAAADSAKGRRRWPWMAPTSAGSEAAAKHTQDCPSSCTGRYHGDRARLARQVADTTSLACCLQILHFAFAPYGVNLLSLFSSLFWFTCAGWGQEDAHTRRWV
jgi:hypothetical protein